MHKLTLFASLFISASTASADVIVRDTISPGTWRGQPTWVVSAQNETFRDWPALTFTGNGERVSRLGVVAMFTDGDGTWNPSTLDDGDFETEIGFFTSQADWLSNPTRLSVNIGAPSNANWLTPIATYGGINYLYLEFDLSNSNLVTTNGGLNLLSVTFNPGGFQTNALGYLAGGLDGVTDYLHVLPPGPRYTGTLNGLYSQLGRPLTNVAGVVVLESSCRGDFNGDGFVDFFDFDDFVSCFESGLCPPGASADIDGDGFIDFFDFDAFVAAFETGC